MQGGRGVEAERVPHAVGHHGVNSCTFIHLVEVGQRLMRVELFAIRDTQYRRTFNVVQQTLHEVGGGNHILETLLVLDADGIAGEGVGHADGGDVHLALLVYLLVRKVLGGMVPVLKLRPFASSHVRTACASSSPTLRMAATRADWLRRSLKKPAGFSSSSSMMALYMPMQPSSKMPRMILRARSSCASFWPSSVGRQRKRLQAKCADVRKIVRDLTIAEPFSKLAGEVIVLARLAPQRVEGHARLYQRSV